MTDPKPAMTMREIREQLGHPVPPPGVPDPEVLPTTFVVSCLPEGHDDRYTYTISVHYRGKGQYVVHHGMRYLDADGQWDYEDDWFEEDDEAKSSWWATRRFDLDTALRLAKEEAPRVSYMRRSVADVLAEGAQR